MSWSRAVAPSCKASLTFWASGSPCRSRPAGSSSTFGRSSRCQKRSRPKPSRSLPWRSGSPSPEGASEPGKPSTSKILQGQKVRQRTYVVLCAGAVVMLLVAASTCFRGRGSGSTPISPIRTRTTAALQAENKASSSSTPNSSRRPRPKAAVTAASQIRSVVLLDDAEHLAGHPSNDAYLTTLSFQSRRLRPTTGGSRRPLNSSIGFDEGGRNVTNLQSLSTWLTRSEGVRGWKNAWFTSATRESSTGLWTFQSGLDLTTDVLTARGQKAVG